MKAISIVVTVAILLGLSVGNASANDCDSRYVIDDGLSLSVRPTNTDYQWDDVNVQCALEVAVAKSIPIVELTNGKFLFEKPVVIQGFTGVLRGKGMWDKTVIKYAGFEFIGGSPTVEHIHIEPDEGQLEGILAIQDADKCNRPMFVTVDRVSITSAGAPLGLAMIRADECEESMRGSLSINRSHVDGADSAVFLWGFTKGARVSLTNNDFRGDARSGACIISTSNHIAMSAIANSCYDTQWGLVVEGNDILSRADYYLRGNTFAGHSTQGRIEVLDYQQPINVHLQGNRVGVTRIGFEEDSGYNVMFNAVNNTFGLGGDYTCVRVVRATSLIARNVCNNSGGDLFLQETTGSTVNQPSWVALYATDPVPNRDLLSNTQRWGQ